MTLQLYNTLTRRKEAFQPIDPTNVRMYVCGPTVYQRIHIGNARPLIVFDVLYRLLRHLYGPDHVTYVRNITDIDDKIIDQARKNGEPIEALTERTTKAFHEDAAALGCLPPTHEPRATEHIPGMIALIERLVSQGHAYAADGHVLFHVPSMPAYGRLSGRHRDEQIAGARVEVAPYKRDPADFVLWKPSTAEQPGWESPWGRGRPGWHIECSAMSEALLGVPFDIHGGGLDLIFPHHENEIAQTCCAHGLERMANYWLHNGFVEMRGEKMAKSVGNILRLDEALSIAPGEAIRFWMLGTHYRQPIDCSEEALKEAKAALDRFYGALERVGASHVIEGIADTRFLAAVQDDLNTSAGLAVLHDLLAKVNRGEVWRAADLVASAALFGLLQQRPGDWLRRPWSEVVVTDLHEDPHGQIGLQIAKRAKARQERRFAEADRIRAELAAQGIILEDTPTGTTWRRA